jgi:hypothetical protein
MAFAIIAGSANYQSNGVIFIFLSLLINLSSIFPLW